jgi:hypothetical protein
MRCCYHIQSHRSPEQVDRLVATIKSYSPDSVVHISHDSNGSRLDVEALESYSDTHVEFHPGGYGDYSHIDRYLAGVEFLDRNGIEVDWFVNITGQDYPLVPLDQAEAELVASGMDGFMEYWDMFGPDARWPASRVDSRYHFQHRRLMPLSADAKRRLRPLQALNRVQPFVRVHVSYGLVVGRRAAAPFGPDQDLQLHGGSAFSSLRWPVVEYLRDYLADHPDVVEYFRNTLSPVEAVFQTVLCSSPQFRSGEFRIDPDCRRYFDFSRTEFNHPKDLTAEDLPAAIASGAHFARKFDYDRRPELMDTLDAHMADLSRQARAAG